MVEQMGWGIDRVRDVNKEGMNKERMNKERMNKEGIEVLKSHYFKFTPKTIMGFGSIITRFLVNNGIRATVGLWSRTRGAIWRAIWEDDGRGNSD